MSLLKALSLLGLGRDRVHRVPVDGQGRMRAEAVPSLDDADDRVPAGWKREHGRVRSGAARSAARAREAGAWVHVDGAFGLWAAASPRYRHLTDGFDLADSWSTDAHKWPNVGYDCGIAFVRDADASARGDGGVIGVFHAGRAARAVAVHARDVAPRPRRRVVGSACAPWAAAVSPISSSGPATTPALRRRARATPATRFSTTSSSTRCWCRLVRPT